MRLADGLSRFLALALLREVGDLALHLWFRIDHLGGLGHGECAGVYGIHELGFGMVNDLLGLTIGGRAAETRLFCGDVSSLFAVLNFRQNCLKFLVRPLALTTP
jgi:hypothetical protein